MIVLGQHDLANIGVEELRGRRSRKVVADGIFTRGRRGVGASMRFRRAEPMRKGTGHEGDDRRGHEHAARHYAMREGEPGDTAPTTDAQRMPPIVERC